jgi:hypothetical protein
MVEFSRVAQGLDVEMEEQLYDNLQCNGRKI